MIYLITIIAMLLSSHTSLPNKNGGDQGTIEVTLVEGELSYRPPFSAQRKQLKAGTIIPEGTMISVSGVARLEYKITYKDENVWRGKEDYLSFRSPIDFRIDRNLLRDVVIRENYLDKLSRKMDKIDKFKDKSALDDLFNALELAWEKLTTFIVKTPSTSNFVNDLYEAAEKEVEIGLKARPIELVSPSHGGAHYALNYPTELRALWRRPKNFRGRFFVYMWPSSTVKDLPLAETNLDYYYLQIEKPGSFYIQITSTDQQYMSRPHLVHFGGNFPAYRYADENNLPEFEAKFPLDGQDILYAGPKYSMIFAWHNRWIDSVVAAHLILESWQKKTVVETVDNQTTTPKKRWGWYPERKIKIPLGSNRARMALPPGRYRWHIRADYREKNFNDKFIEGKAETGTHVFRIRRIKKNATLAETVLQNLKDGERFKRIYLATENWP